MLSPLAVAQMLRNSYDSVVRNQLPGLRFSLSPSSLATNGGYISAGAGSNVCINQLQGGLNGHSKEMTGDKTRAG